MLSATEEAFQHCCAPERDSAPSAPTQCISYAGRSSPPDRIPCSQRPALSLSPHHRACGPFRTNNGCRHSSSNHHPSSVRAGLAAAAGASSCSAHGLHRGQKMQSSCLTSATAVGLGSSGPDPISWGSKSCSNHNKHLQKLIFNRKELYSLPTTRKAQGSNRCCENATYKINVIVTRKYI